MVTGDIKDYTEPYSDIILTPDDIRCKRDRGFLKAVMERVSLEWDDTHHACVPFSKAFVSRVDVNYMLGVLKEAGWVIKYEELEHDIMLTITASDSPK